MHSQSLSKAYHSRLSASSMSRIVTGYPGLCNKPRLCIVEVWPYSLHNMLSHLQTTGSSHANISTPLKCTITVSHTDCALLHLHASSYIMLRLAPNNVYIHLVIISWLLIIRVTPANFRGRFDGNEK